ncbi:hypothetical protein HK098_003826 [Nowakowskiella sp. JEL0407]|nr:hypothetical protein HK098_003826 [Nowakowskiella sp. JEL0407]
MSFPIALGQSCQQYPSATASPTNTSGICQGVINYSTFIPAGANITFLENSLSQLSQLLQLKASFPTCANAYAQWACTATFPRCGSNPKIDVPCLSICQDALSACTQPFTLLQQQKLLPNCTFLSRFSVPYPETQCIDKSSVGNWTFTGASTSQNGGTGGGSSNSGAGSSLSNVPAELFANGCPPPFVFVPSAELAKLDDATKKKCFGPCCVPCPFSDALYTPGSMQNATEILEYVRMGSAGFALLVFLSYVILPGYQARPRDLILYSAGSLFLWQATVFFAAGDTRRIQCTDQFTASTQFSNKFCAVQSGLVIFGAFSIVLWASVLIINLHLHLVWKKNYIDRFIIPVHIFVIIVVALMTFLPLYFGYMKYEFGSTCFVTQEQSNKFFFFPLAAIIFPMFLLHFVTFIFITRASFRAQSAHDASASASNSRGAPTPTGSYGTARTAHSNMASPSAKSQKRTAVVNSLRMQWRPMLLALIVIATFITFWLFHMLQLSQLLAIEPATTAWVQKWILCLFTTQNTNAAATKSGAFTENLKTPYDTCSNLVLPNVPAFAVIVIVDAVVSTPGLWIFVIFGLRSELFNDWVKFIRGGCCCGARKRKKMESRQLENFSDVRTYALGNASTQSLSSMKAKSQFTYPPPVPPIPATIPQDVKSYTYAQYGEIQIGEPEQDPWAPGTSRKGSVVRR